MSLQERPQAADAVVGSSGQHWQGGSGQVEVGVHLCICSGRERAETPSPQQSNQAYLSLRSVSPPKSRARKNKEVRWEGKEGQMKSDVLLRGSNRSKCGTAACSWSKTSASAGGEVSFYRQYEELASGDEQCEFALLQCYNRGISEELGKGRNRRIEAIEQTTGCKSSIDIGLSFII